MKRLWSLWLALVLFLVPVVLSASRGVPSVSGKKRIALVIGNSAYQSVPLKNPVNDASDMAAALERLGFEVIRRLNADERSMVDAITDFGKKLRRAEVGLFYYAGHGIQIDNTNYLVPVGCRAEFASQMKYQAVEAGQVLGVMKDAGSKLNICILDACRNNPFSRSFRTAQKGLAQMDAPKGSIIAYATSPGKVAEDGRGRNGTYTKHLLRHLSQDLNIKDVFNKTGLAVMADTDDRQIPWISATPVPPFCIAPSGTVIDDVAPKTAGTGRLTVTANVPDASVYVDGRPVGRTPLQHLSLDPGSHRVRVEKNGYDTYRTEVMVSPGRQASLDARLFIQASQTARLYVRAAPADAEVRILNIGPRFTQGIALSPGRYQVAVLADGYEAQTRWVTLDAGEDKQIDFRLTAVVAALSEVGKTWTEPVTGMAFVWVPEGCFRIGSPPGEFGRGGAEGPVHEVCVDGFWMGKTEVTNAQFRKFRSGHTSKDYKGKSLNGDNQPVVYVSWEDARGFVQWLSQKTGKPFRLPTEAEWEYACRAGTRDARYWGGRPDAACRYANVHDRTSKRVNNFSWEKHTCDDGYAVTAPVGRFQSNDFGLYDMLGNVWEWCSDWYGKDYYKQSPGNNPQGPSSGSYRVNRGGSWRNEPGYVRSADRNRNGPDVRSDNLGFRLALSQISR